MATSPASAFSRAVLADGFCVGWQNADFGEKVKGDNLTSAVGMAGNTDRVSASLPCRRVYAIRLVENAHATFPTAHGPARRRDPGRPAAPYNRSGIATYQL